MNISADVEADNFEKCLVGLEGHPSVSHDKEETYRIKSVRIVASPSLVYST